MHIYSMTSSGQTAPVTDEAVANADITYEACGVNVATSSYDDGDNISYHATISAEMI